MATGEHFIWWPSRETTVIGEKNQGCDWSKQMAIIGPSSIVQADSLVLL